MSKWKKYGVLCVVCVGLYTLYRGLDVNHTATLTASDAVNSGKLHVDTGQYLSQRRIHSSEGRTDTVLSQYDTQRRLDDAIVRKVTRLSQAVIVLTYMRSGSSMTGDILQRHKDVFYVFEPTWALEKAELEKEDIIFINGTRRIYGTYNKTELYLTDLKGWLTCDFNRITLQSLFSYFLRFGRKTEGTWKCLKQDDIKFKLICIKELMRLCKESKTKIVKVLRISMTMARSILEDIPRSKVIHLIRDPRATMHSRKLLIRECSENFTGASSCSKTHCDSVYENTKVVNKLQSTLRDRVVTVRYEDIIREPLKNAKRLYDFVGMEFTDDVKGYVYNITLGGRISDCAVCSEKWQAARRPNSSASSHVGQWKSQLTFSETVGIQRDCKLVLRYYGYKIYDVED